ncbi:MAG: HAMP domain-containing sensor histidine kinase [Actinomycetota bacterium]
MGRVRRGPREWRAAIDRPPTTVMKILLCDRGNVLADFQHLVRAEHPDAVVEIETDGYRAVELAYAGQPDVVVTEVDLAGVAGVELIRRFREAAPRTRVLVWTTLAAADTSLTMLGAGAAGYLLKSDAAEIVVRAIDAVVRGGIALSPSVSSMLAEQQARARLRELELEDTLARSVGELEQMTTAKAEFLANISHELRTPVTVAKGIAHVLANRDVPEEARKEFLDKLDESLEKLMGIVDGILTIAELDKGSLELERADVDLAPVLQEISTDVGAKYDDVSIEHALPPRLPANCDLPRIAEVLRHLVDNACRYSPAGGTVTVRARAMDEGAVVSITDRGEGIQREMVNRAFDEPFSVGEATIRKERAGVGLGLHMARKLVIEHGGVMWADPLPGGGTRVSFCLPARPGQAMTRPPALPAEPAEADAAVS